MYKESNHLKKKKYILPQHGSVKGKEVNQQVVREAFQLKNVPKSGKSPQFP